MKTTWKYPLALFAVVAFFFATTTQSKAEDTSANPGGSTGGNASGGNDSGIPQFQAPTPIDQGSPGKMPQNDRKQSSAMAKAMLAGAMAQQQVSCFMMQSKAMQEKGDNKMLMMMMAQQACQQAAETAKAMAENDKSEKQSGGDREPAKGPTMKTPEFKMAGNPKPDEKVLKGLETTAAPEAETAAAPEIPESKPFEPQSFAKAEAPAPSVAAAPAPAPVGDAFVPVTSVPNTIERTKLGYDETGKEGAGPNPDRQLGIGTTIATSKPGAVSDGANGGGNNSEVPNRLEPGSRGAGNVSTGGGEGSGGGSGGSSSGEGGGNPLEAMMAFLNAGEELPVRGPGSDILTVSEDAKKSGSAPNLFEYATYRYRKAATEEGKVRTRGVSRKTSNDLGATKLVAAQK